MCHVFIEICNSIQQALPKAMGWVLNLPKRAVNSDTYKLDPYISIKSPNCEKLLSSVQAIAKAIHNTCINISKTIKQRNSQSHMIQVSKALVSKWVSRSVSDKVRQWLDKGLIKTQHSN